MGSYRVLGSFSFGQVAALSDIKPRTLDHWAATGFLAPSIKAAVGTGTRRVYSFSDVVAARAAKALRSAGISLQSLRKVVQELRRTEFGPNLSEACLILSGKNVYVKDDHYLITMLAEPGQAHLPFTVLKLGPTLRALRHQVDQISASPAHVELLINPSAVMGRKAPTRSRQLSLGFSQGSSEPTVAPKPINQALTSMANEGEGSRDPQNIGERKGA
jgi:DNA-binding transcriptional MerR regulator